MNDLNGSLSQVDFNSQRETLENLNMSPLRVTCLKWCFRKGIIVEMHSRTKCQENQPMEWCNIPDESYGTSSRTMNKAI